MPLADVDRHNDRVAMPAPPRFHQRQLDLARLAPARIKLQKHDVTALVGYAECVAVESLYTARGAGWDPAGLNERGATNIFQIAKAIAIPASASQNLIRTQDCSDPLTPSDAGRRHAVAATAFSQLVKRRKRESRTRCPERMAERDRASVRVKRGAGLC